MSSRTFRLRRLRRRPAETGVQPAWSRAASPSLDDIDALANEAFAQLPDQFRQLCADLLIRVEDFPSDDALAAVGLEDPFSLLGLFEGQGMAQRGATMFSGEMPNTIHLYRRPILDYWAEHEEELGALVAHVLIHEIGHHFGLSDEDMERIEREAD